MVDLIITVWRSVYNFQNRQKVTTRYATCLQKFNRKKTIFLFHIKLQVATVHSLNCCYYLVLINPLHKPDDVLTIKCILHFHTAVLLSCSLNTCMHSAWMFDCLFLFEMASSNVNESIRTVFTFLRKDFTHTKSTKTHASEQK